MTRRPGRVESNPNLSLPESRRRTPSTSRQSWGSFGIIEVPRGTSEGRLTSDTCLNEGPLASHLQPMWYPFWVVEWSLQRLCRDTKHSWGRGKHVPRTTKDPGQ